MSLSEFSLINQFFKSQIVRRNDVTLGIGDDAAITNLPPDTQLVSSVDTLVSGVHFPQNTSPYNIGFKSLAVNLSDMAAMGAQPAWALLAITMPSADESWIRQFCDGFFELATEHNVQLIGGDTTQGPLTISVQLLGFVPAGKAILRSGASAGDHIYVSGTLGDAAAGLHYKTVSESGNDVISSEEIRYLIRRLEQPSARVALGLRLGDIASAAIDISDGLAADLGHILSASNVGATLYAEKIPLSQPLLDVAATDLSIHEEQQLQWALHGGDDYELCFTVNEKHIARLVNLASELNVKITEVGKIESEVGIRLLSKSVYRNLFPEGYEHFSKS